MAATDSRTSAELIRQALHPVIRYSRRGPAVTDGSADAVAGLLVLADALQVLPRKSCTAASTGASTAGHVFHPCCSCWKPAVLPRKSCHGGSLLRGVF